jgi:hypothetical protein
VGLILLKIITRIESRVAADKYLGIQELNKILQEEISGLLLKLIQEKRQNL